MDKSEALDMAAKRLHHLSMRYSGALMELAQGSKVGLLPKGTPGLSQCRDFIDLILLTRAEINGITKLLVDAKVVTIDQVTEEFTEQYQWLTDQKAKYLGVKVDDDGLVITVGGDGANG